MKDKEEIRNLIDNFLKNLQDKNLDKTLNLFKNDAIGIGTGGREIVTTYEDHIEHFELTYEMDEIYIKNLRIIELKVVGDIAWTLFTCDLKVIHKDLKMYDGNFRISFVCEKDKSNWLISQHHISVPQVGTDDIKGMPTKENIKNNIEELIRAFELYSNIDASIDKKALKQYLQKAKDIVSGIET
ncbi:MAG: nuclear transport factor 2 family protein [Candidatus Kariarchaeaceae archaeon]|jgi:ketosteroid isomerase-like protein